MKIKRFYGNSVIGECHDCGKQFQNYLSRRQAYSHAKATGHNVRVEITSVFHYN